LSALLDAAFSENQRQAGEITTAIAAKKYGVTIDQARDILERKVTQGIMVRRRPAKDVFYRKA
jgi:hypothetical protein